MSDSIFISYRRDGSSWSARTLHDGLKRHFAESQLFMDVEDIDYGADFVSKLEREVGRCGAMLAVIGPEWLDATDGDGNRRLENPDDFIAIEIGMGLKRRIPVIPVLIDGAQMPAAGALPESLKRLSQQNAIELRHASFEADIERLAVALKKALGANPEMRIAASSDSLLPDGEGKRWLVPGLLGTIALLVVALLLSQFGNGAKTGNTATADGGGIAVVGDLQVGGDLKIEHASDPKLLEYVQKTVGELTAQFNIKDKQIAVRDEQTRQLSDTIAVLARQQKQPNAPAELEQALANLQSGDTEAAKAFFRQVMEGKAAEAKVANQLAARAAQHLGTLLALDDEQSALEAYQQAGNLDPENSEVKARLASIKQEPGKFRLQATLDQGGDPVNSCFHIFHAAQDLEGKRKKITYDCTTTAHYTLNAGRYFIEANSGHAWSSQEFELKAGELINTQFDLQAGKFRLQATLDQGSDPVNSCFHIFHAAQDLEGNRKKITYDCTTTAHYTLNAGRYFIEANSGHAWSSQEFELKAGELINTQFDLQAGKFRLQATLDQGSDPVNSCFHIFHAAQDLEGKRKKITYDCTTTAHYTLNAGRYYIFAKSGEAEAAQELEVKPGELIDHSLTLKPI
jgi:tetratricopeptide (TPR) repeat protein